MTRPKFIPGSKVSLVVRNRSGKKCFSKYLAARLGVFATWAEDLIAGGHVNLDGALALPGATINLSDGTHEITVRFPEAWPRHMAATELPLTILYEDDEFVALNKPSGIVVHPARGHLDNQTLQNGVRYRYRHLLGLEETTIGPPHRLDKDTSGVLLFSLSRRAYMDLVEQFSASRPQKEYLAILAGEPSFSRLVCDSPLGNDPDRRGNSKVLPIAAGGKAATTEFIILGRGAGWALALAKPRTGRPHQIRVHAASLGFPLIGDDRYNPAPKEFAFGRQALHASALTIMHPAEKRTLRIEAPLPDDMRDFLQKSGYCGKNLASYT